MPSDMHYLRSKADLIASGFSEHVTALAGQAQEGLRQSLARKRVNERNRQDILKRNIRVGINVRIVGKETIFKVKHITPTNYMLGLENENGVVCGPCSPHNVEVVEITNI